MQEVNSEEGRSGIHAVLVLSVIHLSQGWDCPDDEIVRKHLMNLVNSTVHEQFLSLVGPNI